MNSKLKMKAGFSESGFGCCGHFTYCDMGKGNCFYAETDPAVKNYCAAYIRNHSTKPLTENQEQAEESSMATVQEEVEVDKTDLVEQKSGQLSLF